MSTKSLQEMIAEGLLELRRAHGLSQDYIALEGELDRKTISRIEHQNKGVRLDSVDQILLAMDLTAEDFISYLDSKIKSSKSNSEFQVQESGQADYQSTSKKNHQQLLALKAGQQLAAISDLIQNAVNQALKEQMIDCPTLTFLQIIVLIYCLDHDNFTSRHIRSDLHLFHPKRIQDLLRNMVRRTWLLEDEERRGHYKIYQLSPDGRDLALKVKQAYLDACSRLNQDADEEIIHWTRGLVSYYSKVLGQINSDKL
ncbi:helix-turn-helix domain-containing protein [Hutsoniella sourekii]